MKFNLPYKVRVGLYIFTGLGTPLVAYLLSKGVIGGQEVTLWSAEVTLISGMAALNVTPDKDK